MDMAHLRQRVVDREIDLGVSEQELDRLRKEVESTK